MPDWTFVASHSCTIAPLLSPLQMRAFVFYGFFISTTRIIFAPLKNSTPEAKNYADNRFEGLRKHRQGSQKV